MDLAPHELAQGAIDELMAREAALAAELLRHDARGEVRVVVGLDADLGTGQAGADQVGDLRGFMASAP